MNQIFAFWASSWVDPVQYALWDRAGGRNAGPNQPHNQRQRRKRERRARSHNRRAKK